MTRAILLPGMDGTGELLTDFAAALAPELDADIVSYPRDVVLDYPDLVAFVRDRLPREEPFVLIAESFSGPVAISLAASRPEGLIGVVLCASFAQAPQPGKLRLLARLHRLLPLHKLPLHPAMFTLMGRWASREWRQRIRTAIGSVDAAVLRGRMMAAADVDVTAQISVIACPLLYLKGSHDRLVDTDSWRAIRDRSANAVCMEIEGPHFLLQAKPRECAAAIK